MFQVSRRRTALRLQNITGSVCLPPTTHFDVGWPRGVRSAQINTRLASPHAASSTLAADVLDHRLSTGLRLSRGLSGGGVLCRLEPVTDADRDGACSLNGMRGEYRAARRGGDARQCGEAADGDEHR